MILNVFGPCLNTGVIAGVFATGTVSLSAHIFDAEARIITTVKKNTAALKVIQSDSCQS